MQPTPPETWNGYDPNAGDFKEEIIRQQTRDGVYHRDSYISAYVLGEEVCVYCRYSVKQYAGRGACFQVQSVLAKLSLCRTRGASLNNCIFRVFIQTLTSR